MILGFGEMMLRLQPKDFLQISQANAFEATYAGAEASVCVSLQHLGMNTSFLSALPNNALGDKAISVLRSHGVEVGLIYRSDHRMGIYFTEKGASQRPSKVLYDRKNSAFSCLEEKDFDWEKILKNITHLHFTGITLALNSNMPSICLAACKCAKNKGILVSCDMNYRSSLWRVEAAQAAFKLILPYVDILIGNEEDAQTSLGIEFQKSDILTGDLNQDEYLEFARKIHEKYQIPHVAFTLRKSLSASRNLWSGMVFSQNKAFFSKEYDIQIVDRFGGGDSFAAALIYGFHNKMPMDEMINFAAAASCLKQTTEGDFNLSNVLDVMTLVNGDASGRVKR